MVADARESCHLQLPGVGVNNRHRQVVPHIEKVCRGDKTLGYEFKGGLSIEWGGSVYNKGGVAFWISYKKNLSNYLINLKIKEHQNHEIKIQNNAVCCLQRGCLKLPALLLVLLHQKHSGCQS